jgi:hypothetical protein
MRTPWRSAYTLIPAVLALAVAGAVPEALTATSSAAATPSAAPAATQSVRVIARQRSLNSLGDGVGHLPRGTKGPETQTRTAEPDAAAAKRPSAAKTRAGAVNRSLSPRPRAATMSAAAAAVAGVPVAASTPVDTGKPGLGTSLQGLNLYQERYVANNGNQFTVEPPDQGLCVGNGYVLETVNDVLRVFTTSGHAASPPIDLNSFYGYPAIIDRTTGISGPSPTDPSCLYDSVNHRWIHIALTLDTDPDSGALTLNNHIDIAVSKTASPLGGWNFYTFNATDDGRDGTPTHTDCPCIGDYPHIGADRNGIYITTNEYPWDSSPGEFGNNFNGAQLYAFSRHALTSGAAHVRLVQISHLALTAGPPPTAAFTLIPANAPDGVFADANGGSEYFLSSTAAVEAGNDSGRSHTLGFWTLSNTRSLDGSQLALSLTPRLVGSERYGVPPASEQKLGQVPLRDCEVVGAACPYGFGPSNEVEGPLDSSDSRIFNTWYDGHRVWGSLSTIVQVGGNIKAGSAWFAFNPGGTIADQGYVATNGNNVIYPGIATLANGRGVMAVNLVGHDWYPSAAYVRLGVHGPGGAIHVARAGAGPEDGFCEYDVENCAGTDPPLKRPRWGDYPAAQAYGNAIWIASEYIAQTCTFEQYLADFTCGQTRGALANWSTRISEVTP